MSGSYLNIVLFLLTTYVYYSVLKPKLDYTILTSPDKKDYISYIKKNYMFIAIYFLLVVMIQFIINASIISSNCGGNLSQNIGASGMFTFLPWTLIFGILIIIMTVYPSFKNIFSDIIGYFWVANPAKKILDEILISQEIKDAMRTSGVSSEENNKLLSKINEILKLRENPEIIINNWTINNFQELWKALISLMKPEYRNNPTSDELIEKRNALFQLIITKENVGESIWYILIGSLVCSLVQFKIIQRGCLNNPQTMEKNYQEFLEAEKKEKEKQNLNESTTYKM
jgi:hypothetical protein